MRVDHTVYRALRGCDRMYHVASTYSVSERRRDTIFQDAVLGTQAACEAARRAGTEKVVITSSAATLGATDRPEPMDEQHEFNLPLYSWFPGALKRYCERLAVTTHPALANYAKYPAVHWFSFYGLRDYLRPLGFRSLDRFDLIDPAGKGALARTLIGALRAVPLLRFLGHVATASTYLVAVKTPS